MEMQKTCLFQNGIANWGGTGLAKKVQERHAFVLPGYLKPG